MPTTLILSAVMVLAMPTRLTALTVMLNAMHWFGAPILCIGGSVIPAVGYNVLPSEYFAFLAARSMCVIPVVCDNIHVTYRLRQQHFHLFSVDITKKYEQIDINSQQSFFVCQWMLQLLYLI